MKNYWMMLAILVSGHALAFGSTNIEQRPIDGKMDGFNPNTKGGLPNIEQRPIDGKMDGFNPNTKGGLPNAAS